MKGVIRVESRCLATLFLISLACAAMSEEQPAGDHENLRAVSPATAEEAWKELEKLRPLEAPIEWKTHPPTEEEQRVFQRKQVDFACWASDRSKEFQLRFPNHEMAGPAKLVENAFLQPYKADVLEHRVEIIEKTAREQTVEEEKVVVAELKGAREMLQEFPEHFVPNQFLLRIARRTDVSEGKRLVEEVKERTGLIDWVKEEAEELGKKLDAVGKPLVIKFTAIDGREVEMAKLKGKVVLVDFWATWCVPCVGELPAVKAAYEKLHAEGFEIVGVSFDEDRGTFERFVKKEKLAWPQYCDGKGWTNVFGKEFVIKSIPTMWLVDRQGNLRDLNGRRSLEEKVRKLLAEPH
jgi:thiol-disulfide isomerase/thioredoxin